MTGVEKAIDARYLNADNSRKRLRKVENPCRRVTVAQAEDDNKHYIVKCKDRHVGKYKSQFKRKMDHGQN